MKHVKVANGWQKEFIKTLEPLCREHSPWEVFTDFCAMAAISLWQPFYHNEEDENTYLKTIRKYRKEQAHEFPKLLACVVEALEERPHDFLGEVFHALELHNKYKGQFFTPFNISLMMSRINVGKNDSRFTGSIEEHGYITLGEPACGSGGMVIAFAEAMRELEYNPQQHLLAWAKDIDYKAAHMAYIQLSLLGIPAMIECGNTLAMTTSWQRWTCGYFWNYLHFRKGFYPARQEIAAVEPPAPQELPTEPPPVAFGQLEFNF